MSFSGPDFTVTVSGPKIGGSGLGHAGGSKRVRSTNAIRSMTQDPAAPGGSILKRCRGPSEGIGTIASCQTLAGTSNRTECGSVGVSVK